MISIQMGPQTRLLQNNDTLMLEKIQSSLVNTIPLWKSQMVLALGLEHSRQATQAQSAVTEMTNQLLQKNADMLKMGTVEAAREALRQDRERARLYGLHTGAKWGEVGRYDLTVDSGPLGVSGTVELLSQFIALKTMRRRSKEAAHAGTTD